MPRIRSIHPSLFTDEDYMSLSPFAMAAWPGIWVEADDNGVFEWKPLTLKARLLPCAAINMGDVLAEYEARGMVQRFNVAGKEYGAIRNFRKFQRPEKPKAWHPLPDELREFVSLPPTDQQPVADQSPTVPRKSPQMEDVGGRMEEIKSTVVDSRATRPDPKGSRLPAEWTLPADWRSYASEKGCADPDREAEKFRDHWHAKAGKDARKADWFAAWRTWIGKAAEFAPTRRAQASTSAEPQANARQTELAGRAALLKTGTPFARDSAQRYPRQDFEEMVRLNLLTVADLQRIGIQIQPRAVG